MLRNVLGTLQKRGYSRILTPGGQVFPTQKNPENALKRFIVDKIRVSGPITVAEYMKLSVGSSSVGYYGGFGTQKPVFGEKGDFITSPELTQLFGEMIGVWLYYELANTGHRGQWQLVECGPGTGQLMLDVVTSLNKFNEKDVSIHLVETSDALINEQEKLLCVDNSTTIYDDKPYVKKNKTKQGYPIFWYKNVDDIPENFTVFIANEFLDALPIHQFKKNENGAWNEIYVSIDENNDLCFMNSKGENLHSRGLISEEVRAQASKTNHEISPDSGTFINQIVERIVHNGGFGLIIDYGHDGDRENFSLRAYKKHDQVHPLSDPGNIDITADVDFKYLKDLVSDRAITFGPIMQREFLAQLGIGVRLRRLLQMCDNRTKQEHLIKSYNFLMQEMGEKFKVLSVFPKTLESILEKRGTPEGFSSTRPDSKKDEKQ
ncbi:unnamed protein product [Auanema sp. JU1783]|nr:unnamed protein product [Auanema sp. JU1783]